MSLFRVFWAVFILLLVVPCYSDSSYRVHRLYLEEEHRSDYTTASVRDNEGFLWIATDNGLKRYDGYNLRVFLHDANNPASIGSTAIRKLLLQSTGTLWAAGSSLSRYHAETESFTSFYITQYKTIRAMYEDKRGMLWLGGEGFGLLRFDPDKGRVTHTLLADKGHGYVSAILQHGSSHKIWLATDSGLYLFDTETHDFQSYALPLVFTEGAEAIHGLAEDRQGKLWLASHEGLHVMDPETGRSRVYSADPDKAGALSTNMLWTVFTDSEGQIWVGTDKYGVHKYSPETDSFSHFPASANDKYRFPASSIVDIYEDSEGSLWFAAGYYGMYRLSTHLQKFKSFQHSFDTENSLGFDNVLGLHEDRNGYIWIATDGGGLNRFDPKTMTFKHFRHNASDPQSISSDAVLSIAEDSAGFIWLGTWSGGLNRLDLSTGKFHRIERDPGKPKDKTLSDNHVFRIVVDERDRLLLAVGRTGLQIYDPATDSFESYSPAETTQGTGIRSDSINDILQAPTGHYWIAGYKGIELFSPTERTFWTPALKVGDPISDLHLAPDGILWIATHKNIARYNPIMNQAEFFSVKDGFSDEHAVSIEQDDLGYLWVATRRGLNRFDPRTKEVTVFDEQDGLSGSQFNRFSHLKTRNGMLYFGGTNGFSYFDPLNIPRNEYAPKVHITSLEVNRETQVPGLSPWLKHSINHTDELVLPSTHRDLALKFAATNLISPSKNLYRYRLNGLELDWVTTDSSRRLVHYSNLPPGKYQFQVLASNNEGVWGGSAKQLNLTILPAWWQTWWARGCYVLMLLASMYGFSFWRLRLNRRRQRQLEALVNEQTSELKAANRSITQLNSELEQRVAQRTRDLSIEIEERRESEARANYIAYHDALTGLYNRAWLLKHLDDLIRPSNADNKFALFFVGGDRFRKINDTYGHLQGDRLLAAAARRLNNVIPAGAHAVRLGSDEFTVVLDRIDSEEQAVELADHIISAFREQFTIDPVRMSLSVSVGFVLGDSSYTEASKILGNANIAMQRAKDRGRGVCQMFDEDVLQQTLDNAALEGDLKMALLRQQFSVVYQPIIVVESGALNGFEILIRWRHPERGMVPPDKFIAVAESLGLIFDIGLWVLERACEQLKAWEKEMRLPALPTIAVNLSPVQLEHADFLARIDAVFERTGIDRKLLKFEITESALMKHTETVDGILESLRERGIELAIDDFGTGYSSLSYLDKLPVQVLKIDRSFVNALTDVKNKNGSAHEIVRATISLAHNLGMRVVAEGIETDEQLRALGSYGCDYGQGYLIARPLSPADATAFLVKANVLRLPPLSEQR